MKVAVAAVAWALVGIVLWVSAYIVALTTEPARLCLQVEVSADCLD